MGATRDPFTFRTLAEVTSLLPETSTFCPRLIHANVERESKVKKRHIILGKL